MSMQMQEFMKPIADAWSGFLKVSGGMADEHGNLRHRTYSGTALRPLCVDSDAGEEIDDGVFSRGRRWSLADDVDWGDHAINGFRAIQSGSVERARSAIDTGVDLGKYRSVSAFRQALADGKVDGAKLAKALTPATLDEASGLFLVSELILNLEEIVRVERVMPYARQILPMKFLNAPGAESYRFSVLDDYGDAEWTSDFDGSPPMVGQRREQIRRPLEYLWMGAKWSIRELWQWAQARANGVRLPDFASERPRIAREALLRQENLWLLFGGPTNSKIHGLLSPANAIPKATPSNHWSTLSAAENMNLVAAQVTAITIGGVEVPDTILMPIGQYNYYGTTQWPNTEKMILQVMMDALKPLGIREIAAVPELTFSADLEARLKKKKYDAATAQRYAGGIDGKDCMVVLSRRPDKVAGIVSQDVKSLAPRVEPAVTSVTMVLGSGGCEVRYPWAHRIVPFNPPPP